jgi:hypothetical protein
VTRTPPARLPGEPRAGDRDYGPLGGLPDDVHFFIKERQRDEDALARSLGGAEQRKPGAGLAARLREFVARLRR